MSQSDLPGRRDPLATDPVTGVPVVETSVPQIPPGVGLSVPEPSRATRAKVSMSNAVDGAKQGVRSGASSTKQGVKTGASKLAEGARQNPIGTALGAMATGFVLGYLLPSTGVENKALGPIADGIGSAAQSGKDAVTDVKDGAVAKAKQQEMAGS